VGASGTGSAPFLNIISSGFYRIAFAYGYYVVDRINFQTTLQSFLAVGSIFQKG
jgi:hypothetical protein